MKLKKIKNGLTLTAISVVLTACGSSSGDSDQPSLGAALGVEQSGSAGDTVSAGTVTATIDEAVGASVEVPDTATSRIQVFDDFTFDTSRSTSVYMSVPEAVGVGAEASFCTDYTLQDNGDYRVNYDSCVLTTPLLGGVVDQELHLVNQHTSVLGVVWFKDTSMPPVFEEFNFD